jgi:hypothetical protein
MAIFKEFHATNNTLKQQVIGCVDGMYLQTLSNRVTGYANVTTRQFLEHLYATYGCLSPSDLIANNIKMKLHYDPPKPIEVFIAQIDDGVALATAANAPYSPAQIIAIAYHMLFSTGMFSTACRDWQRRPPLKQTWATFKVDFTLAHQEFRDSQAGSTGSQLNSLLNHDLKNLVFNFLPTTDPYSLAPNNAAFLDSGCTSHFLKIDSHCVNCCPTDNGIHVKLPNGTIIRATHTALHDMPHLPIAA